MSTTPIRIRSRFPATEREQLATHTRPTSAVCNQRAIRVRTTQGHYVSGATDTVPTTYDRAGLAFDLLVHADAMRKGASARWFGVAHARSEIDRVARPAAPRETPELGIALIDLAASV